MFGIYILLAFELFFSSNIIAQAPYLKLSTGLSQLRSEYKGKYEYGLVYGMGLGLRTQHKMINYGGDIGFRTTRGNIKEINKNISITLFQLSVGPEINVQNKFTFRMALIMAYVATRKYRIQTPQYNFDFNLFDYSYTMSIYKNVLKLKKYNFDLEFYYLRSFEDITDNNFLQNDNLKISNVGIGVIIH